MTQKLTCNMHNMPCDSVCLAETCRDRLKCQICVKKHEHKFYLDDKEHDKRLAQVRDQIISKLDFVKTYKKSNISNLCLVEYKDQQMKKLDDQLVYLNSKILQETLNFNLEVEKVKKRIKDMIESTRETIMSAWTENYNQAIVHFNCDQQVALLKEHFSGSLPVEQSEVERYVKFLYSDEFVFRFNKQFDSLKVKIGFSKKQNKMATDWLENQQIKSMKVRLFIKQQFRQWQQLYKNQPIIQQFEAQKTRQSRQEVTNSLLSFDQEEPRQLLQIKIKYENFHHIFRIARFDNQKFITSGGRSINTWNRISLSPDRVYPLEYPSYGLLRFKLQNSTARVLFGLSNGQLCQIHPYTDEVNKITAHDNTIRQIIQYDSNHLITASQDWTMKVWALEQNTNSANFVVYRDTLKGHAGKVYTMCKFGPNVLSGGIDGTIKLWDIIRSEFDETFPQQKQIYSLKQIRPELFGSAGQIKQVRFWDYRKTKAPVLKHPLQGSSNWLLKFDQNLIAFNDRNIIKIIDIRSMKQPVQMFYDQKTYSHTINHMEFLSDNEIGMGGSDNFITVWKY